MVEPTILPVVRVERPDPLRQARADNRRLRDALRRIEGILLPAEQTNWLSTSGKEIMEIIRAELQR